MAFFADLSPYTYFPNEPPGTVNIGWLDLPEPIPVGETSDEFRAQLRKLCERLVRQTRGQHRCSFCNRMVGSAEIRVMGATKVYAAPELILHYVEAHGYRPPDEFMAAVLTPDPYAARLARIAEGQPG